VSWLDHLGGLVGGVLAGWLLRARTPGLIASAHDQPPGDVPVEAGG